MMAVLDGLELQHLLDGGEVEIVTPLRQLLEALRSSQRERASVYTGGLLRARHS